MLARFIQFLLLLVDSRYLDSRPMVDRFSSPYLTDISIDMSADNRPTIGLSSVRYRQSMEWPSQMGRLKCRPRIHM